MYDKVIKNVTIGGSYHCIKKGRVITVIRHIVMFKIKDEFKDEIPQLVEKCAPQ